MTLRTAYLTYSYPATSQTFVVDEVEGLRAAGVEVETWGIRPGTPGGQLTERYRAEAATTRTLRPIAWGVMARAHLRALRIAPLGWASTLTRAVRDRPPGLRALAFALGAFAVGIGLWRELDRTGTRHLHVHFAGSPTHIASLVTAFGNAARRGGPAWTWSVSVHGPVEFTDLTAMRLPERLRDALFLVAISSFARSQLLSHLPGEQWDKVRVVRCGVDPYRFASGTELSPAETLKILYVGRLVALKGQPVLFEALARLRGRGIDAHLTVVGDGPERARLERLAARIGVKDHTTFTRALGHDEVCEQLSQADVFCLPSFAEGVPVVLMEAMAAGLPVVTTWIAGIPELVSDGREGYLVRPGDVREIEEVLARLAADPDLRREVGRRGRAKVERDHNARVNALRLAEVHREYRSGNVSVPPARADIAGCRIDRLTMAETRARCEQLISKRGSAQHVAINAAKIVAMQDDPELRAIVDECEMVSADGQSIVWASQLLGDPLPSRVAGIDLMHELLDLSERMGYRVFFLGAEEDVLQEALANLSKRHPALQVVGARNGYFSTDEEEEIAESIRASSADILFVAMSSPKKEYWLASYGRQIDVPFVMGVGGSVDILAGRTRRAPLALQRVGLEWAYRLAQEPRRLLPRYLVTNFRFSIMVLRQLRARARPS